MTRDEQERENSSRNKTSSNLICKRFDGFLPVVLDTETSGCDAELHALLEISAILIEMDQDGNCYPGQCFSCHVQPFEGAKLDPEALAVNRIDPYHPFRFAIHEREALGQLFDFIREALKRTRCRRALLVGHNAHFDLGFIKSACKRLKLKSNPFHAFTCIDTATLGGLIYGKTVLAKALKAADISFDKNEAHSAIYDAEKTAQLFCKILNKFKLK